MTSLLLSMTQVDITIHMFGDMYMNLDGVHSYVCTAGREQLIFTHWQDVFQV